MSDFLEVTGGIERWEDWCAAWSARAAVHEEIGRKALAAGHRLSTGQHLTTAAVCYHFAKFMFVNDMEQLRGLDPFISSHFSSFLFCIPQFPPKTQLTNALFDSISK